MFQHCLRPFNNTVFKAISLVLVTICVMSGQSVLANPGKGLCSQSSSVSVFAVLLLDIQSSRVGQISTRSGT